MSYCDERANQAQSRFSQIKQLFRSIDINLSWYCHNILRFTAYWFEKNTLTRVILKVPEQQNIRIPQRAEHRTNKLLFVSWTLSGGKGLFTRSEHDGHFERIAWFHTYADQAKATLLSWSLQVWTHRSETDFTFAFAFAGVGILYLTF